MAFVSRLVLFQVKMHHDLECLFFKKCNCLNVNFFTTVIFIVRKKTDAQYIGRESTDVYDVFVEGRNIETI